MKLGSRYRVDAAANFVVVVVVVASVNVIGVAASPQDFLDRAAGLAGTLPGDDDSAANLIPHHHNNFGCDCMEYW